MLQDLLIIKTKLYVAKLITNNSALSIMLLTRSKRKPPSIHLQKKKNTFEHESVINLLRVDKDSNLSYLS